MANLLGQNIGTNYKGILNLNTLNGNLSGTLESVTDGDGNASALQLSTSLSRISANLTIGGSTTASARLHVRGDGTNPIARFENSSGSSAWAITATGSALTCESQARIQGPAIANDSSVVLGSFNNLTTTTLTQTILTTQGNIVCAAGSGNKRISSIEYGINNSGAQTGTATGIFLNATETALNGMGHNLIDLQMNSVSRFSVSRLGALTAEGITSNSNIITAATASYQWLSRSRMNSPSDGVITLFNNGSTDFNRLQLGGTTNAFPALKRNGAALEVRLADDSGFAAISATSFTIGGTATSLTSNTLNLAGFNCVFYSSRIYIDNDNRGVAINNNLAIGGGNVATNSSSVLELISTTKGFLLPRMTEAQRDAITTPAEGLLIYNTTTQRLNIYNTSWVAVH